MPYRIGSQIQPKSLYVMPANLLSRSVARGRTGMTRRPAAWLDFLAARSAWLACLLCGVAGVAILDDYDVFIDSPMQRAITEFALDYAWRRSDALLSRKYRMYDIVFERRCCRRNACWGCGTADPSICCGTC